MAAAATAAFGGHVFDSTPAAGTVTPFGGPVPVTIAHVGHIDVDLEPGRSSSLSRVACFDGAVGASCYVGR